MRIEKMELNFGDQRESFGVMSSDNVSEEEMRALLSGPATMDAWKQKKRRILYRTLLITAAIVTRLFVITYYPELHLQSVFEDRLLDHETIFDLIIARGLLLLAMGSIYIYSQLSDRHFKTISVMGLVVCSALMWGDLQIFMLAELPDLTLITAGFFALRVWVLYLLLQNYLDYRR